MKRVILSLVALAAAVTMAAQVRPQSNHTVSTTLGLGLEYGFEWAFAGQATVIGRVGYASKDFLLRSSLSCCGAPWTISSGRRRWRRW